jgi:hypothetical protein
MATHASPHAQPLHSPQQLPDLPVGARPVDALPVGTRVSVAPWAGLAVLMVAATLVFWLFDALPFQDLPAHAGFIALRHRLHASPFEQRFFVLAPHLGPYSLFRSLGDMATVVIGPVGAVRALATLPVIATPLALLWARRRLHGDSSPAAAYFGLALSFGFMTLLGFASYLLGVAALLVALTLWLELLVAVDGRAPLGRRREIAVACFAPVLFVAHGHAFVLFLAMAGVTLLAQGADGRFWARVVRVRALLPAVALAAWAAWTGRASSLPAGSVAPHNPALEPHFQGAPDKLSLLITPTLITRTGVDLCVGILLWALLIACAVSTVRSLRRAPAADASDAERASRAHSRALLACLPLLGGAFAALPHSIGWFGFVDGRLVPLLLLVAVMAIRRESLGRALAVAHDRGAPIAAGAMVTIALVASHLFQTEARGWHEVLAAVPAEARLLNLPLEPNSDVFTAHPFIHYDKLALAERPLVVSDVWFHQGSALYPTAQNPSLRLPDTYSESDLRRIDWPAYRLEEWDFVLIRTRPDSAQPSVPASLALTAHRGGWWLFRTGR